MTRIEIFSDAAFAFAVTILVISSNGIPSDYPALIEAMKGIPAFAASFASIMVFWVAHRKWSRRYGLDDGFTTVITLGVIFTVLIYVYPLKLMISSFFHYISGGWLPSSFLIESASQMAGLVVIYGAGVCLLSGLMAGLHWRSLAMDEKLQLDEFERIATQGQTAIWSVHCAVALLSALFSLTVPDHLAVYGGFIYFILPAIIPMVSMRYGRRLKAISQNP